MTTAENTASRRALHLITLGVFVIALASVFLVGLNLHDDEPVPAAAPDPQAHGIITIGKGTVAATPDQLTFTVSATNTRPATAAALAATDANVRAVTAAAKRAGVAAAEIETAALSVKPRYAYTNSGEHLVGYSANQKLRIVVRTVGDAGKVIGAVTRAGGNTVSVGSIKLSVRNRAALVDKARTEAVQKAKASAEAIAQAAGRHVGELEFVQEIEPQTYPYGYYDQSRSLRGVNDMAFAAGTLPTPISPGEQNVSVTVQVRWSVAPAQ